MNYRASLTRISHNEKTGPIPVSTTESSTCPPTCGQYDTCYLKYGRGSIHWRHVDQGTRGVDWNDFCDLVSALPSQQLWRHNQGGDLPGDGVAIDSDALYQLVVANKGKRGFTYTHYPLNDWNVKLIEAANAHGFTVNVSCDTLTQADRAKATVRAPVAVVLHSDETRKSFITEGGNKVIICPNDYQEGRQCVNCGICHDKSPERAIVGFKAHGTKKRIINLRLEKA